MAAALHDQLQQRRLSPIELIREALNFMRDRWRALLVIGLVTIVLPRLLGLLVETRAVDPRVNMSLAEAILVARGAARVFSDWMASLGAMSTALVLVAWVQGMTLEPVAALGPPGGGGGGGGVFF